MTQFSWVMLHISIVCVGLTQILIIRYLRAITETQYKLIEGQIDFMKRYLEVRYRKIEKEIDETENGKNEKTP